MLDTEQLTAVALDPAWQQVAAGLPAASGAPVGGTH